MQTKKQSLIESITNTAIGFTISLGATFIIFPLVGIESTSSKNIIITIFFTVISILRGYIVRRFFNKSFVDKNLEETCIKAAKILIPKMKEFKIENFIESKISYKDEVYILSFKKEKLK